MPKMPDPNSRTVDGIGTGAESDSSEMLSNSIEAGPVKDSGINS